MPQIVAAYHRIGPISFFFITCLSAVLVVLLNVAVRHVHVDDLSLDELALQIRGDEVDASNLAPIPSGESE